MAIERKPYLKEAKPGYWYVRRSGRYQRIHATPNTPEFDRIYWEIVNCNAGTAKRSWSALITSYKKSDRWGCLRLRTRQDYERVLLYILQCNADRDITGTSRKDVLAAMEKNKHRTRFANYLPAVMSVLFEHAIDLGWTSKNPAKGVRRLKTPIERTQPHKPWSDSAVAKWRSEAKPLPRLIFEIGVGSVQRPSDWVNFRWSDYDGDSLRVKQSKTGLELYLPCTKILKNALSEAPRQGFHILTLQDGRPMSYRRMAEIMRQERDRLGVAQYDLHALRYRGVQELAWAGCSDEEIASFSGHATKEMIRKYAGEARQRMSAMSAVTKRNT
ncbi:MAG: tyrosine-type recombinase/integrase [Pseudomonadota bacterium]